MKVLSSGVRPETGSVVTIGVFDGVHRGHCALIEIVRKRASELGCASVVVTFDPHPASVVRPDSAPKLLTDLDQKLELLADSGIDYTLVVPFDTARSQESAEDFVNDVLVNRLNAKAVVIGYDFHFGKDRRGNAELLRQLDCCEVIQVGPIGGPDIVSSTAIRNALAQGDVALAASMLGRPHEVRGLVVMGDGRGRDLGFPTANVHVSSDIAMPADGVYAGEYVFSDGSVKKAAISLGIRPHFYEDGVQLLEAYVLDFDGDLYGQHARIRFTERIRSQQRFDSLDALIAQITADVSYIRAS